MFEHASGATPRRHHGYCVDDVARGLVVLAREDPQSRELRRLSERYLAFVAHAQIHTGAVHNRLGFDRRWHDAAGSGDWWGRAVWGLGTVAGRSRHAWLRDESLARFEISAGHRSPSRRSMAFAALGAAEVLTVRPEHRQARRLLADAARAIGVPAGDRLWPWPERRLFYANAVLPEVLLAAGVHLNRPDLIDHGMSLLSWLRRMETVEDHLSVTPVGGWTAGDPRPGFDQQPIEVAALADAFARALVISGDSVWAAGVRQCVAWFRGDNDLGKPVIDADTGGGCDGLGRVAPSRNQGAESTLALISTLQLERTVEGIGG
ncbi:glycosyltransferase [Hamadaea sp. NPDC051192]|uniref:glycosyltransferase n=1 Tax=Hamadaea sp. NPDC051192 TaxID=3154940 RepID=UPI003437DF6B